MESNSLAIQNIPSTLDLTPIQENGVREYDIVINIPYVNCFPQNKTEWFVYISQILKEKMNEPNGFNPLELLNSLFAENKKHSYVVCYGNFKMGKTFFINKINNSYLPNGTQSYQRKNKFKKGK
ncbi:hypothetical protein ACTFIY_012528 [Dictyostelium cf. discoideum]